MVRVVCSFIIEITIKKQHEIFQSKFLYIQVVGTLYLHVDKGIFRGISTPVHGIFFWGFPLSTVDIFLTTLHHILTGHIIFEQTIY